jgi:hypothetical protein
MLERACRVAAGDQGAIDIEVPARSQRVDDVADWRAGILMPAPAEAKGVRLHRDGPRRPVRGCSTRFIGAVYDWLGFGVVDDAAFRDLVIVRIIEPTSKADSRRVLADLGVSVVSYITQSLGTINGTKWLWPT